MKRVSGFTLLEMMIVLVIIAVLAGLAIPAYMSASEKSRKLEAIQTLGTLRAAQQRYFTANTEYASSFTALDFDPTATLTGNLTHFSYTMAGGGAGSTTFTATATRNALDRPASVGAYTVTINQDGTMDSDY